MIVDAHAHIIVPEITRDAAREETWRPRVTWEDGQQVVELAGRPIRSALREFVSIEGILAAHETAGVDHILLCPWVPLLRYDAAPTDALHSGRIQNEALARLARAHPRRVSALGTIPLQDPPLAARELEALMNGTGLRGIEVAALVNGVPLGDDRFRPVWEVAEGAGALIFIHPTTRGFDLPAFRDYYLWNTVANPLETTVAAAHLVMAGVLEAHPGLRMLLAHGGGAILSLRGRLRHAHGVQPQARSRLRDDPVASLRRFFYDTVVHDAEILRALVEFAGAHHVLLGSDYPFDMGLDDPVSAVRALELSPDDEAKILGGNAAKLLGLEG